MRRLRALAMRCGPVLIVALTTPLAGNVAAQAATCIGDCDGSGSVSISELVTGVAIALGTEPVTTCEAFDCLGTGTVPITSLIDGVRNALDGCAISTPTPTAGVPCPLAAGKYTLTQLYGGILKVSTFSPFPFPIGGTLILDVSGARQPDCLHSVVVPFPGGFQSPAFCIPATGASIRVIQTGCGVGQIDSNGGADYTITELGDTSYSSSTCDIHQSSCPVIGPAPDSSMLVNVTIGDGAPDTCPGGGTANALVTVPVRTVIWLENVYECPAADGTYDPDKGDVLLMDIHQILDFTTDTNTATFRDLDGDGCFKSGIGPAGGFSSTGSCMDLSKLNQYGRVCHKGAAVCTTDADCGANGPCDVGECQQDTSIGCDTGEDCMVANHSLDSGPCQQPVGVPAVTTAASGTVGSAGGPTYDLTFTTTLPSSVAGPDAPLGARCDSPPLVDFHGTVDRCIH